MSIENENLEKQRTFVGNLLRIPKLSLCVFILFTYYVKISVRSDH